MEQPKVYNTEEELIKWLEDDLEEQSKAWQSNFGIALFLTTRRLQPLAFPLQFAYFSMNR